jgi:hypothetical protein
MGDRLGETAKQNYYKGFINIPQLTLHRISKGVKKVPCAGAMYPAVRRL